MQKFYKILQFDHVDIITNKLLSYIEDINEVNILSYKIDHRKLLNDIPELKKQLDQYNFGTIGVARILVTAPNTTLRLHTDGNDLQPKFIALNWPMLNFRDTEMRWFNSQISVKDYEEEEGYGTFDLYDRSKAEFLFKKEITEPTLVNIRCPHDVVNNHPKTRFMFSIRFDKEPWELFNAE